MEYNLRDVEWSWYWYQTKLIKLSDKCELELYKWNSTFRIELNEWIGCKSIECELNLYEIMNISESNVIGSWIVEWKSIKLNQLISKGIWL